MLSSAGQSHGDAQFVINENDFSFSMSLYLKHLLQGLYNAHALIFQPIYQRNALPFATALNISPASFECFEP